MFSKKRLTILLGGLLLVGVYGVSRVSLSRAQDPRVNQSDDDQRQVIDAIRRGGLREAARLRGHYIGTLRTSNWLKYDIESLTTNSANIVVGTPVQSEAHLSADGRDITTEYHLQVLRSVRGRVSPGEVIVISLPGGKVEFEDGTSAEIRTPDLEGMVNGTSYILFLRPMQGVNSYALVAAGQGLFEITAPNRTVKPHGHSVDTVQKYRGANAATFLELIQSTSKKHPETSNCCR